jgi:DNA-binding MarR family transcriptional regulator
MAGCDRRARLPAALDAVLRSPVLTPKGLAAGLAITVQTATGLLRELREAKLVTEITGRRSFRAFAVMAKA